ncbi:aspartic peptidase domain-containing protein [Xylaria palmicola]|nr:aspartic peptidase domain-containing protein [Xylaria palmicola]
MIFTLLLASLATGFASDETRDRAQSLQLPIRSSGSSAIEIRDDPGYGHQPLRANATQKSYLSPYTVELAVGTPPQRVHVAIDLFSSNLWVNPDCDASPFPEACCLNGNYDQNASTSATDLDCSDSWGFSTPYGSASGCYTVDDVRFAGAYLGYVQVGVANQSLWQTAGRLGLGFGCHGEGGLSVLDSLQSQGLIAKRQFSIALGSANPSAGTVDSAGDVGIGELLLSGINIRKYAGELRKLVSHPGGRGDDKYYVTLTSVGFLDLSNCTFIDTSLPTQRAFFDFTTIISVLPLNYIEAITAFFPDATYDATNETYRVPCHHRAHDASINFYFDTLVIHVPLRDFILEKDDICYLGIIRSVSEEVVLGQSFLRAAYTAFDLDDEAIYMAQYENCGDQLSYYLSPFLFVDFNERECDSNKVLHGHYHRDYALDESLDNYKTFNDPSGPLEHLNTPLLYALFENLHESIYTEFDAFGLLAEDDVLEHTQHGEDNILQEDEHVAVPDLRDERDSPRDGVLTLVIRRAINGPPVRRVVGIREPAQLGLLVEQRLLHAGQHEPLDAQADGDELVDADLAAGHHESVVGDVHADLSPGVVIDGGVHAPADKTVTVTVGVLTSTVFMPSPITIPGTTCDCAGTEALPDETGASCEPTTVITEYRTRTVSHCGAGAESASSSSLI